MRKGWTMRSIATALVILALAAPAAAARAQGINETSLDEITNAKGGGAAGVDKVLKELGKGGLKATNRTEILGKLVGARYCAQAAAGGATFTLCEYDDAGQAGKGAAKRAAMFGEKNAEHTNGATVLSLAPADDEKARKAAAKIADHFNAIGKPLAKKQKEEK